MKLCGGEKSRNERSVEAVFSCCGNGRGEDSEDGMAKCRMEDCVKDGCVNGLQREGSRSVANG